MNLNLDIGIGSGEKIGDHLFLTLIKTGTGAYTMLYLTLWVSRISWFKNFLLSCARASFIILAFHIKATALLLKLTDHLGHHAYLDLLVFMANVLVCLCLFQVLSRVVLLKSIFLPSYGISSHSTITIAGLRMSIIKGYHFFINRLPIRNIHLNRARWASVVVMTGYIYDTFREVILDILVSQPFS